MKTQVIVLNGASSSGKSELARSLQSILPEPWLTFGVDTLIGAMPATMQTGDAGIVFGPNGQVTTGTAFQLLDNAWCCGIAAMVRAGARVIVDEVFLGGEKSQQRWKTALEGLEVLWVAVRCELKVASAREIAFQAWQKSKPKLSIKACIMILKLIQQLARVCNVPRILRR